jgi:hypothetical protein
MIDSSKTSIIFFQHLRQGCNSTVGLNKGKMWNLFLVACGFLLLAMLFGLFAQSMLSSYVAGKMDSCLTGEDRETSDINIASQTPDEETDTDAEDFDEGYISD